MLIGEDLLELAHAVEGLAGDQAAHGDDGLLALGIAPGAVGVEVLESQANGVHAIVAGGAQRTLAMQLEHIAQRGLVALEVRLAGFQRGHVGRWRRRGRAEEIGQHEQAALHR
jgi:hypothetical protein